MQEIKSRLRKREQKPKKKDNTVQAIRRNIPIIRTVNSTLNFLAPNEGENIFMHIVFLSKSQSDHSPRGNKYFSQPSALYKVF